MTTDHDQLMATGFELPAPDTLDDAQIARRLEARLGELAKMQVEVMEYVELSPREIYTRLVERSLREERPDVPLREGEWWTIDVMNGEDLDDFLTNEELERLAEGPADG